MATNHIKGLQHTLLFKNPVLRKGLNVTIRKGNKWMKETEIEDELNIYETGNEGLHQRLAHGKIIGKALIPYLLIPEHWLGFEHDSSCENLQGLLKAMKTAYGETFSSEEYVTVVIFEVDYLQEKGGETYGN